ncbi:Type VI secretion system protein ImpJ [Erythrobacter sp. EC-HK427]|nr:Type VI secretion system protein ImpJ [Erythrobacter sp. EC-HK427]
MGGIRVTWENKPVWSEGMFLRPQHFQQFDRHVTAQLEGRVSPLLSYAYGLTALRFSEGQLKTGKLVVEKCSGVFPDGTPFRVPEEVAAPMALDVKANKRDAIVHLCIPEMRAGAAEVALDETAQAETRFVAGEFEASDSVYGSASRVAMSVGKLQLSLRFEDEGLEGYQTLPVARVTERKADDSVSLDQHFIPCGVAITAGEKLPRFLSELEGMVHQRAEAIAGRLGTPGAKSVADVSDYLTLMILNRAESEIRHLASLPAVHPADFYSFLVTLAGELSTYMTKARRPNFMPTYMHREQRHCFNAVILELNNLLSQSKMEHTINIPLQLAKHGVRWGQINDRSLFTAAEFILAVRAEVDPERVRANLPKLAKVGSVEHISQLVNKQLPGASLSPMGAEPRQIPFTANTTYFRINTTHEQWKAVEVSGKVAIHVQDKLPGIDMELWAIREPE